MSAVLTLSEKYQCTIYFLPTNPPTWPSKVSAVYAFKFTTSLYDSSRYKKNRRIFLFLASDFLLATAIFISLHGWIYDSFIEPKLVVILRRALENSKY